ncbi:hypothetical protein VFPFJ_00180 [Purpureocillium lilacinum]|uniref:Secreted protein n=1 Tax=Purpureocillium lilacinum TaxID=33203 RepID=A0A179HW06_PURLI|nr:hypothetical protein VFPFJ_00180 [Purpureocillium lilacinum]OAQ94072.1 hypothetical protein VFPFJ_00180 [Purpureocillium lilacinum]
MLAAIDLPGLWVCCCARVAAVDWMAVFLMTHRAATSRASMHRGMHLSVLHGRGVHVHRAWTRSLAWHPVAGRRSISETPMADPELV